ncbi:sugar ABC transporter substrate-binding protein [Actinokineospora cianjurensis]|uniref:Ribose transport system substrate-binding protein n=1 Tax=Actinokineospora cianjurensis TaxID=585224 RepID=A0A421B392_9PSEU|nr:substrate-binding domain-containing protein [Actinokineospora cianjurensis]RLK58795.1 ribose transport system substrate-binding protein [Actinokineospora cianjurensis]
MTQVFLVVSAFEQKYWLNEFIGHVLEAFDHAQTDVVLKRPRRNYDRRGMVHHLRRLVARGADYSGGLIMPIDPAQLREDLVEFCAEIPGPVVFLDLEPFESEADYPPNTAFIGYPSWQIGEAAARWLAGALARRDPAVFVAASREHSDRQDGFVAALRAISPEASVVVDDSCDYLRSAALDAVRARLLGGHRLDAVFCTNDEMALGAVEALRWQGVTGTVVVGVDGAAEARAHIDTGTGPLRATVVQDGYEIAAGAVDLLHRLRTGRPAPKRTLLVPRMYANRTRESTHPSSGPQIHNEMRDVGAGATLGYAQNVWITNQVSD